jgi:hypothetical protein
VSAQNNGKSSGFAVSETLSTARELVFTTNEQTNVSHDEIPTCVLAGLVFEDVVQQVGYIL